jgi:mono/diheme cytochrome c family protein
MVASKLVVPLLAMLIILAIALAGCAGQPTATVSPTNTPVHYLEGAHIPNIEDGERTWAEQQCNSCHGPLGLGGIGPALADTPLEFEEFLHIVRTAIPPKPAYNEDMLPEDEAYHIYAWLRTQRQLAPPSVATDFPTFEAPSAEDMLGMTIWTSKNCDSCHGVFAQGGPKAPTLAGLNYPVKEELERMRQAADDVSEHSPDNIDDATFERLYKWLQAGCSYTNDCAQ